MSDSEPERDQQPAFGVPIGTVLIGTFELLERIAIGGMGEVYRGVNIHNDQPVAIKVVLPELARDETIIGLFKKESMTLNSLSHDAIVRYHVFATDKEIGRPFLAMEYVSGESLATVLRRGPMDFDTCRRLVMRVASGLSTAHKAGVIHRDLSPDNIIIQDGNVDLAKIIDFGIAKSQNTGRTFIDGKFAGKYNYVSPEQLGRYRGEITGRSDIYSLGLVTAAALRGAPLDMTGGGTPYDLIELRQQVPDLSDIDERMRGLVHSMLEPDPDDRPRTMEEVFLWLAQMNPESGGTEGAGGAYGTHGAISGSRPPLRPASFPPSQPPVSQIPASQIPVSQAPSSKAPAPKTPAPEASVSGAPVSSSSAAPPPELPASTPLPSSSPPAPLVEAYSQPPRKPSTPPVDATVFSPQPVQAPAIPAPQPASSDSTRFANDAIGWDVEPAPAPPHAPPASSPPRSPSHPPSFAPEPTAFAPALSFPPQEPPYAHPGNPAQDQRTSFPPQAHPAYPDTQEAGYPAAGMPLASEPYSSTGIEAYGSQGSGPPSFPPPSVPPSYPPGYPQHPSAPPVAAPGYDVSAAQHGLVPPSPYGLADPRSQPPASLPPQGLAESPFAQPSAPAGVSSESPFGPYVPPVQKQELPPATDDRPAKKGSGAGLYAGIAVVALVAALAGGYAAGLFDGLIGDDDPGPQVAQTDRPATDTPGTTPPADTPPADTPPADTSRTDTQPTDTRPDTPPTDAPSTDAPPTDTPPATQPTDTPPATQPTDTLPADTQPTDTQPDTPAPDPTPTTPPVEQPVQPAGTTPAQPTPPAIPELAQQVAWVLAYRPGPCFSVRATSVAGDRLELEAIGRADEAFDAFATSFESANGYSPRLDRKLITAPQCAVADFMNAMPDAVAEPPSLDLSSEAVASGERISGRIDGIAGRFLDTLIVDSSGKVIRLPTSDSPEGGQQFGIGVKVPEGLVASMLVIALASDVELPAGKAEGRPAAAEVLPKLIEEIGRTGAKAAARTGYFRING